MTSLKAKPKRLCLVCRKRDEKQNLSRFVLKDSKVTFDVKQRLEGRGVYLHGKESCLLRSSQIKFWKRAFRREVSSISDEVLGLHKETLVFRVRV